MDKSHQVLWQNGLEGTESASMPVIGNFTGDITPDVFAIEAVGVAPSYTGFKQILIDGSTGNIVWKDSSYTMLFSSPLACDLNQDGRDEAVISVNQKEGNKFHNKLIAYDFQNNNQMLRVIILFKIYILLIIYQRLARNLFII